MKRILVGLALIGALSACGADKPDTVVVQAPPVEQPTETVVPSGQQFVDALHAITDEFDGVPDADLVAAGRETCSNITVYGFDETALAMMQTEGATPKQAGYMMAASVRFLCPEHTAGFKSWVDEPQASATV